LIFTAGTMIARTQHCHSIEITFPPSQLVFHRSTSS